MLPDPALQGAVPPVPEDAPAGALISPDTRRAERLPPGQSRTRKWPVLDTGIHPPPLALADWTLTLDGLVEETLVLTAADWASLPRTAVFADMHCVTRWSRLGNLWEGVLVRDLLAQVRVRPEARAALIEGRDVVTFFKGGSARWNTNLPLDRLAGADCLLADTHDGAPLTNDHGGPVRLVVPPLYAWKSAKWVHRITFVAEDAPGYWERGGYHLLGDPWKEQRFRFSDDAE